MQRYSAFIFTSALFFALATPAKACELRKNIDPSIPRLIVPKAAASSLEQQSYFHGLLRLALERTEAEYGPCELVNTRDALTQMRSAASINGARGVDLFWGTASIEREKLLHPIRIPLLKGLMAHKVLLIRANDQARFSAVNNLEQLQALRAGVGADWPDSRGFLANGINVVRSSNYEALYKMLSANRFDFFPRGANQVLSELRANEDKKLAVEQHLVLVYPAPVYFFVKKDNVTLARRIEQGLQEMITDGTLDTYFYQHPLIVEALTELRLSKRRPIYLENPLLPEGTPLEENELWMNDSLDPLLQ
jgi:hypothetical protein